MRAGIKPSLLAEKNGRDSAYVVAVNILRNSIAVNPSFTVLQVDICMKPGIFVSVIKCGHFSVDNGLFTRKDAFISFVYCQLHACILS